MEQISDIATLEAIFKKHYEALCTCAWRFVQDTSVAENIVDEVFFILWANKTDIQLPGSVVSYLHATTVNNSLNYLKSHGSYLIRENFFAAEPFREIRDVEQASNATGPGAAVHCGLSRLPPACRAVFVLSRYERLSYNGISLQLNIPVNTVENHMGNALRVFRSKLLQIAVCFLFFLQ